MTQSSRLPSLVFQAKCRARDGEIKMRKRMELTAAAVVGEKTPLKSRKERVPKRGRGCRSSVAEFITRVFELWVYCCGFFLNFLGSRSKFGGGK